jgi:hypothetical protein
VAFGPLPGRVSATPCSSRASIGKRNGDEQATHDDSLWFSAFANGGVKVECWGSDCNNVTLGQICGAAGFSTPVAVACDDTSTSGGYPPVACGTATCIPYGGYSIYDKLGDYCDDGGGYDAVVTCN